MTETVTTDQLPMTAGDAALVEVSALRAEVERLRPITDAAEYLESQPGHAGCVGDRDCDEYTDGVDLCSHVERRYATYAHVIAHTRLAALLVDVQRQLLDRVPGSEDVLDTIREGLYAVVVGFQTDVSPGADLVTEHQVYVTAVEETDEDYQRAQAALTDKENDRG